MEAFIDQGKIKQLFKEALAEVIEERKEVLEDIALVWAIQEGEDTGPVSKNEVLKILEDMV